MMPGVWARALSLALLHSLWQGALVALVLGTARAALGSRRPRARYLAGVVCMLALMALAVATLLRSLPDAAGSPGAALPLPEFPSRTLGLVSSGWAVGVLVMLVRLQGGRWRLSRIALHASALPSELLGRLEPLVALSGVRAKVAFLRTSEVATPMAMGCLRPVILLPLSMIASIAPDDLELLIVHELAHVRRHDYLVNILQSVCEALLFFNPFVWCVSRWIRVDREYCCDQHVVRLFPDRIQYARALASLESRRVDSPLPSLAANGGVLMNRIRFVLARGERFHPGASVAALCCVLVGLVAVGAWAYEKAPAPSQGSRVSMAWAPAVLEPYRADIEAAAAQQGVDANLLALLILVESGGDPEAKSPSGAVGLMQVMPATAEAVARTRGLPPPTPEQLAEPGYNIDVGAWFLARQLREFGSADVARAVAAYNAGPERVRASAEGAPLPLETQRYQALVTSLWSERQAPVSGAYENWRRVARERLMSSAASPVSEPRVSLPFGSQADPFTPTTPYSHEGVDFAQPRGAAVVAPIAGVVKEVFRGERVGNAIVISHGGGLETRYYHLDEVNVHPGDKVARGAPIGTVGSTGRSTGPHLHFELRDLGDPINPAGLVPGL
jgi:murein DD-endopeptidase MepM/ murein hydrolase activator NlpD/beta-lactamase regulating signal transducer with metallopeptidase domain